ncbi:hypothetical protein ERJ75_001465100 [Trypanosoma vivax]|nr:hypothetical protein ERJ75_001465100 [Trypanosoma vivax]
MKRLAFFVLVLSALRRVAADTGPFDTNGKGLTTGNAAKFCTLARNLQALGEAARDAAAVSAQRAKALGTVAPHLAALSECEGENSTAFEDAARAQAKAARIAVLAAETAGQAWRVSGQLDSFLDLMASSTTKEGASATSCLTGRAAKHSHFTPTREHATHCSVSSEAASCTTQACSQPLRNQTNRNWTRSYRNKRRSRQPGGHRTGPGQRRHCSRRQHRGMPNLQQRPPARRRHLRRLHNSWHLDAHYQRDHAHSHNKIRHTRETNHWRHKEKNRHLARTHRGRMAIKHRGRPSARQGNQHRNDVMEEGVQVAHGTREHVRRKSTTRTLKQLSEQLERCTREKEEGAQGTKTEGTPRDRASTDKAQNSETHRTPPAAEGTPTGLSQASDARKQEEEKCTAEGMKWDTQSRTCTREQAAWTGTGTWLLSVLAGTLATASEMNEE